MKKKMSNTKIKKYFFFLIIFYTIVDNFILSLKRINVNNSVYQFIQFGNDIFKNIRQKNKNKIYNNLVNYNVYVPNNCKISKINFDNKTIQLNKFPLKNYNIISIDYGYTFMGLCLVCKNKYIYEKIIFKYPNLIDQEIFDLPIKENTIIFYPIHFKNYIFNFFYFFHYLFKCIYNSNLLVIIGSNGSHMDKLSSDMGRYMCYFMNEKDKGIENSTKNILFSVNNKLITFPNNDNIYKKEEIIFEENYSFHLNGNQNNLLKFLLKNFVTKVKDENNTLFSKFYNKDYKYRKDSISACYLSYYFLKYYDKNINSFFLPSKNINYVYHIKK
ncbi:conserved Plasmodium protein, unknown function [Plasmodium berghei]|uniref:Uncharacterized protein n=2 Tax=Plasmodium berghei TaxID=5821 RepID=A0A509AMB8_PLABA|nr:conserved Plasmodium protein, unknown function [Plasmodium berghei ANKA]SCM23784.1 conserved Plasmodium protein, unknown function [Plasmodium berghei]SCN26773.1 conserved Plasmodium protein, unknown function [Plasmodium berghei]SCO61108.1 conserved Plasmodium protein, unknown function [Plasmodium berghei]SCO63192.1 conserved Plasmodium protein, unknown function [Plasmodium berghei]VUC56604.1 conserved Plasmodium protein, unknown function [Plasmodium berghei ANKA]|eukprot:XP_034422390.1 conserved Plasmodium protein, unknown function [Plasmodium berghei ANKA]